MSSRKQDPENEGPKWVHVDKKGGKRESEAAKSTLHIAVPGEKVDRALTKARRELVRVERKFLRSLETSQELPEFAKHEVKIRLRELEGEDED